MQRWCDALGDDARAKQARGLAADPAIEDQLHLLGPPDIEVFTDHLLKEHTTVYWQVEHLREGELGLQDRDIVAIAGLPIRSGVRVRQETQPLAQKTIDLFCRQPVADFLQPLGIDTTQDTVVEGLELDALPYKLALGIFVAVKTKLGVERKVAAELEKERTKIAIECIDV